MTIFELKEKSLNFNLSQEKIEEKEKGRVSFVHKFPIEKIKNLSLDEYVQGTDKNSFCYWLEFKEILFGIGGGNASKFGLYKAKEDGNYYIYQGKNKKQLTDIELQETFEKIKTGIVLALEYAKNNEIEKISTIEIPVWNMVLQKILSIYFPEKFLTIGSAEALIKCAEAIGLKNISLTKENSIQINYECKKVLSNLEEYKNWHYEKLGSFIWEIYGQNNKLNNDNKNYWLLSAGQNSRLWNDFCKDEFCAIGWDDLGDLTQYKSKDEIGKKLQNFDKNNGTNSNNALACWEFVNDIQIEDVIIIKKDIKSILGYGIVESDYYFDENRNEYKNVRKVNWIKKEEINLSSNDFNNLEVKKLPIKTLTNITKYKDYLDYLKTILGIEEKENNNKKGFILTWNPLKWNWEELEQAKNEIKTNGYFIIEWSSRNTKIKKNDIVFLLRQGKEPKGIVGFGIADTDVYPDKNWNSEGKSEICYYLKVKFETLLNADKEEILLTKDLNNHSLLSQVNWNTQSSGLSLKDNQLEELQSIWSDFMNKKENNRKSKYPLNQIFYGAPGTGKTYRARKTINEILKEQIEYLNQRKIGNEENKYIEILRDLAWYEVIAIALYRNDKDKKYKVKEILETPEIKAYIKTKTSQKVNNAIWGQLQIHTTKESKTVNYVNRSEPPLFNKTENSLWYLTDEGIKYIEEEHLETLDKFKAEKIYTEKDFYEFITFHQSYSYEEFVEGIKPKIDEEAKNISYTLEKGIFRKIADKALNDPDNKYVLVIDEINRGNISKILGELITLIEEDKRIYNKNELKITLPYSKDEFGVPFNLYIIGTMNTSDRSIASIDIALRRRFKFIEIMPDLEQIPENVEGIALRRIIETLNQKITVLLDRDHQIGHSYFMKKEEDKDITIEELKDIWFDQIIPLLNEYFYEEWEDKLEKLLGDDFIKKISVKYKNLNEDHIIYNFKDKKEIGNFVEAMNNLSQ